MRPRKLQTRTKPSQHFGFRLVRPSAENPATPSLDFSMQNWQLINGVSLEGMKPVVMHYTATENRTHHSYPPTSFLPQPSQTQTVLHSLPVPLLFCREVDGLLLLFISIKSRATWHWEDIWIRRRQRVLRVWRMVGVPRVWRMRSVCRKLSSLRLGGGRHDAAAGATQAAASGQWCSGFSHGPWKPSRNRWQCS